MKYYVEFQPLFKGRKRPSDDGESAAAHNFETDEGRLGLLPNVGDYVDVQGGTSRKKDEYATFSGKVKSKLFTYYGNESCLINIVVEETDDDWGALSKA